MTAGLDYNGFVTQIATMAVVDKDDPNFTNIIPQAITYAENRICRDLDFLFTSVSNSSFSLTPGSRRLTIPAGTFVVPQQINVITPFNAGSPDTGVRNPLLAVTRDFLDATCGSPSFPGVPRYFAPVGDGTSNIVFVVGPFPDAPYKVELFGTIRPDSLSVANPTTFISLYLPDMMLMASMIYIAGYQRNFGATMANDQQQPVSYESQYQTLLMGAMSEESRKKFESAAWSAKSVSPASTANRGK